MRWTVRPFAVLNKKDHVLRFQDDEAVKDGERVLPVVADDDPSVPLGHDLIGPEYEVLANHVRAYCRVIPMDRDKLLEQRLTKLEAMEVRLTSLEARTQRG